MSRKRGLGRGLDALLGPGVSTEGKEPAGAGETLLDEVAIDQIFRGPYQPRQEFDAESLEDLAASIKVQGVMQPIVVRKRLAHGYEIIAGERRWRAAQLAGLEKIPAVIRDVTDEDAIAMALIENIQREDLNPLEEALALQRLQEEFDLTQQQVADAVGKSRVAVTNLLRLLNLNPKVRDMLAAGQIEMGHARALLSLPTSDQESVAREVERRGLSVRQTEALVRKQLNQHKHPPRSAPELISQDPDTRILEQEISQKLGAPVRISFTAKGNGQIVIRYGDMDQLEGILAHFH